MYDGFDKIPKKSSEWILSRTPCKNVVTFFKANLKIKTKNVSTHCLVEMAVSTESREHCTDSCVTVINIYRLFIGSVKLLVVGKGGDELLSSHIEIGSEWF